MRIVRCVLAAWYLLASTNLPAFALDQLLPQTKTVVAADFPCAHHDCGCKTAEQCRLRCCCHPKPTAQAQAKQLCHLPHRKMDQEPRTVRVSYLSARYCESGQTPSDALTLHTLDPHVPPPLLTVWVSAPMGQQTDQREAWLICPFLDVPDKIPI